MGLWAFGFWAKGVELMVWDLGLKVKGLKFKLKGFSWWHRVQERV